MALDQAANFVREGVTSAISAGDTTINVADASPFPVPPEGYNIVVWDGASYVRPDQDPDVEIMRVTDTDTTNDTLTVARGQEGTTDVSHPDTSVVVVAQTAKMIADIASEKISNPVTETVNADGNDVTNVGALDVEDLLAKEAPRIPTTIDGVDNPIIKFDPSGPIEIPIPDKKFVEVDLLRLVTTATNSDIYLQFSDDNGSSWLTSADYLYRYEQLGVDGTTQSDNNQSADAIVLCSSDDSVSSESTGPSIRFPRPRDGGSDVNIDWTGSTQDGVLYSLRGVGEYGTTSHSVDRIRIFEGSPSDPQPIERFQAIVRTNPGGAL